MDSLQPQIDSLTSNIDSLESALQPLLTPLTTTSATLPLLDKAKLHVLHTYALESLLFTSLRLSTTTDAKAHPVFSELKRVREYFVKITAAEEMGSGGARSGKGRLNTEAAGRFIRAGLSGNEKFDRERGERREGGRVGAKRKFEALNAGTHTRFEGAAKRMRDGEGESVGVVRAEDVDDEETAGSGSAVEQKKKKGPEGKKRKAPGAESEEADPMAALEQSLAEPVSTPAESSGEKNGERQGGKKKKGKGRKKLRITG